MRRRWLLVWLATHGALGGCGRDDSVSETRPSAEKPSLATTWKGRNLVAWLERARASVAADRADAAWAIGEIGAGDPDAALALDVLLADADPDVRAAALRAAVRLAAPVPEPALRRAVADLGAPAPSLRRAARAAVLAAGEKALPLLEAALGASETSERWGALRALASIETPPASFLPVVSKLAQEDAAPEVRRAAMLVLPRLGPAGIGAVVQELRSADFTRSEVAAAALAEAGARAVPALAALLTDPDDALAARAAGVLADVGKAALPALDALLVALRREGQVRFNAADALVAIGAPAVPALEALAAGEDSSLALLAKDALERIRR